jgi:transposase
VQAVALCSRIWNRRPSKPLPAEPYVFAEWKECRVGLDYHVEIDKHYYSVPHQLLREKVWARITARTVDQSTGRPRGSTRPPRARRCVSHEGTAQRGRVPPIDYGDGLRRA